MMKRILSLLLASSLLLAGCAPMTVGGSDPAKNGRQEVQQTSYALARPVYPDFPAYPEEPQGDDADWDAYFDAYSQYIKDLEAVRGQGLTEEHWAVLNAFTAKSTPLVLAEHEGENTVYSPLSLWSALAMLAQCADGDSRQQVLEAMGADSVDALQEQVPQIWRGLYTDDGRSSLILANSIWLSDAAQGSYVQDTLDVLAQKHFASVWSVPMGTDQADQAVTDWVAEQTNGLIGGEGPVVQTKAETLALLASSLYYRAGWTDEFVPHLTEEDTFTDARGGESKVDFMHKTQDANFIRRDGYQAAQLSTQLGEMVFVLPDEGVAPESLLSEPDFLARLEFYGDAATWGEVQWSVPKFDVDSELDLKGALSALGVADLMDPDKADLTALTDLDAFLSEVKQLARVKVDEEGVEAAAVTIMTINCTSAMPEPDPEICVMDLDRPFLFIIRTQDVPLFVGIVNQV